MSFGKRRLEVQDVFLLVHSVGSLDVGSFVQIIELLCSLFPHLDKIFLFYFVFEQLEIVLCFGGNLGACVGDHLLVVQNELTLSPRIGLELRLLYARCRWSGVSLGVHLLTW